MDPVVGERSWARAPRKGTQMCRQVDCETTRHGEAPVSASRAGLSTRIASSMERPVTYNDHVLSGDLGKETMAGLARIILPRGGGRPMDGLTSSHRDGHGYAAHHAPVQVPQPTMAGGADGPGLNTRSRVARSQDLMTRQNVLISGPGFRGRNREPQRSQKMRVGIVLTKPIQRIAQEQNAIHTGGR